MPLPGIASQLGAGVHARAHALSRAREPSSRSLHSPLHSGRTRAARALLSTLLSLRTAAAPKTEDRALRERAEGDTRGTLGAMTLKHTETDPVLTAGTSALKSLSAVTPPPAQQDRRCTSLASVRSRPAPASRPDAPEIAPSATRSSPAVEPNEANPCHNPAPSVVIAAAVPPSLPFSGAC